jgi:hypothetical protein
MFSFTHLLLLPFWVLVLIHHSIFLLLLSVRSECETWNFYRSGSLKTTARELTEYKLDLVGVQARWYRSGTEPAYSYIEHGPYFFCAFILIYSKLIAEHNITQKCHSILITDIQNIH